MKVRIVTVAMLLLVVPACGGGLKEPITAAAGCTQLTAAVVDKCGAVTIDCNGFVACKAAKSWEKIDTDTCAANVKAATDCDAAKRVTCAIACVE